MENTTGIAEPDREGRRSQVSRAWAFRSGPIVLGLVLGLAWSWRIRASPVRSIQVAGYVSFEFKGIHVRGIFSTNRVSGFTVARQGKQWHIHLQPPGRSSDSRDAFSDGTNVYILQDSTRSVSREPHVKGKIYANGIANITKSKAPHYMFEPELAPLWLAYASTPYFVDQHPQEFEIIGSFFQNPVMSDLIYTLPVRIEAGPRRAVTPRTITFMDDGIQRSPQMLGNGAFKMYKVYRKPPYNRGFMASQFKVLEYTNSDGTAVPLRSTFKVYRPAKSARSADDLVIVNECDITITNVSMPAMERVAWPFPIPDMTSVTEQRFAQLKRNRVMTFGYMGSGHFMSDAQVKELPEYKQARAQTKESITWPQSPPPTYLRLVYVAAAVLVALFFLMLARKQKEQ